MIPDTLVVLLVTAVLVHFLPPKLDKLVAVLGMSVAALALFSQDAFVWDGLGTFFAVLFFVFTSLIVLFADTDKERISLFVASLFALMGAAGTTDMFTFYLLWELACLASYYLAFSQESKEPAFRYLVASIVSSSLIFLALALTYAETNSVAFSAVATLAHPYLVVSLLMVGFGLRALIFPLQFWVPEVYATLPPASAAFFAGVLNKLGILAVIRLLHTFPSASGLLLLLALLTMLSGNLFAFVQTDVKRLLAFSSISHVGYMLMGFSVMTPRASTAALLHVLNHAAAITLLFLALDGNAHFKNFSLPSVRRYALFIGGLALAGFPGLAIFAGEFSLLANVPMAVAAFTGVNMAFSAAYYYRLCSCRHSHRAHKLSFAQLSVIISLMAFITGSGLYPITGRIIAGLVV